MQFIDLKAQFNRVEKQVMARIQNVLDHGAYIMGPEVGELEAILADYVDVKHCVAVSSGTDALLIALMALDIRPGDEVITTPFSFFATAEVIALLGAKPIFVDIKPETYNINAQLVEEKITPKTKVIMPVSLYGQCADMDEINVIARKHGIAVVEDAAQSFGATYNNKKSCGLTTIGCTSFFPSKPLGCYGDGGACFTNDAELANIMKEIRVHGQSERYRHTRIGINGRMDSIQAAVLIEKMKIFSEEVQLRQTVAQKYNSLIPNHIFRQKVETFNTSVFAQYTIEVADRPSVQQALKEKGIPTAVHYPVGLHQQPALAGICETGEHFECTENAARKVMSLPMHPYLTEDDQIKICDILKEVLLEKNVA